MPLTFGQIRKIVGPWAGRAGKCATSPETAEFARDVMRSMLFAGAHAGELKVTILAHRGCISMPPEVEVPIKARIDHSVAEIWSKWYSYHSVNEDFDRCPAAGQVLVEDGSYTPLAYNLPDGGTIIGISGNCEESEGSVVTIQGKDITGREVYTMYQGEKITGERFPIKNKQISYGTVVWGEITGVTKPQTNGYVSCFAVNPSLSIVTQFLADWSPVDEAPRYRKFKVRGSHDNPIVHISMLCRIKIKDYYHDNELTPFENKVAIQLAAQRINAETNNDIQVASYKKQALDTEQNDEAGYKKPNGGPVDVFLPLSGGSIRNIVPWR